MKFRYVFWIVGLILFHTSCFDDKGNYDYSPVNKLTIEIQEEVPVLANADTIKVFPRIISDLEGEILADNPNYTYRYRLALQSSNGEGKIFVLDSTFSRDLVIPARLSPGKYKCWFEVTDMRTEVVSVAEFVLNVSSVTTEGWMVLCDEGEDNRVRLDMIARISEERSVQTFDILANDLPDLHEAYALEFFPDEYNYEEFIYLLTGSGCYQIEPEHLTSGPEYSIDYEFARQNEKYVLSCMKVTYGYRFIVDQYQNGYAMENSSGSIYELPVNKEETGKSFKLAPYVGIDRRSAGNKCTSAILYDTDNKRFMQWTESAVDMCFPIPDPEDALFSYTTGKELVYMESTYSSSSVVYAILKDNNGKYYLCGISMAFSWTSTVYKQQYYAEIDATDFDKATAFAFHSNLPYLFYAVGNQLYQYDIYQKRSFPMFSLENENITRLKFNLFTKSYWYSNRPQEYMNIPNNLIIGTEDLNVKNENKGVLRFYTVPPLNAIPTLIGEPYRGFGKIRDVIYRERE